MKSYYAYGFKIKSEIEFPEFTQNKSDNFDILIRFGTFDSVSEYFSEVCLSKTVKVKKSLKGIDLIWNDIKIISLKNDNEVIISSGTEYKQSFLRYLFLGYVLPILLCLNGRLVIHGNAINMDDGAIIFMGISGRGKSTTSLAFHKKGYSILSDDILCIESKDQYHPVVYPGFPRIKLWPDVVKNFNEEPEKMSKVFYGTKKISYDVSKNFSHQIKPIKAIYFIEEGERNTVEEIDSFESLMELIKNSFCFKLFNQKELSENLKQCSNLVNNVPIKTLLLKHSFEDLDYLVELITNDLS